MTTPFDLPLLKDTYMPGYSLADIALVLKLEQYKKLLNWMQGKAVGLTKNGETFIFTHDFEKFLHNELGIGCVEMKNKK